MGTLLDQPHHDGSEAYVLEPAAELGDETTVVLRVPTATSPSEALIRYVRDGDPALGTRSATVTSSPSSAACSRTYASEPSWCGWSRSVTTR